MRWERLFAEVAAGVDDEADRERDALAAELADEQWASMSWRDMIGANAELEVADLGSIAGEIVLAGSEVIHVRAEHSEWVLAAAALIAVRPVGRARPMGQVARSLGWSHVLRALARENEQVWVCLRGGAGRVGTITAAGSDCARLRTSAGDQIVPVAALVALRTQR